MNDELLNYNPKSQKDFEPEIQHEAGPPAADSSNKLSTVFMVVVGLHVLAIVAFVGYSLFNESSSTTTSSVPLADVQLQEPLELDPVTDLQGSAMETAAANVEQIEVEIAPQPVAQDIPVVKAGEPIEPAWDKASQAKPVARMDAASVQKEQKAPAPENMVEYTVVKGDSLFKISRQMGVPIKQIREANQLKSDMIRIGQKLMLPAGVKVVKAEKVEVKASPESSKTAQYEIYTISKGDTLSRIARSYNTTAKRIASDNGINDPHKIRVGMKIKVPVQQTASNKNVPVDAKVAPAEEPKPFRAPIDNTDLAMLRDASI